MMLPTTIASKPTATVTIEPTGRRATVPREHSIRVLINLSPIAPKYADRAYVGDVARRSFEAFSPADDPWDRHQFGEVLVSSKQRGGAVHSVVVSVEGSAVSSGA